MRRLENRAKLGGQRSFKDDFKVLVCESGREMVTLTQIEKLQGNTNSWERQWL